MKKLLLLPFAFSLYTAQAQTGQLVHEFTPGTDGGRPACMTVFKDKLHLSARTAAAGNELWVYDGSTAPVMLFDLSSGPAGGVATSNDRFAIFKGQLCFSGSNGTSGDEPMMYDGTNPPVLLADLIPGGGNSNPNNFLAADGRLYFAANTVAAGRELQVYDGLNPPQTVDLVTGTGSSSVNNITAYNGKVCFSAAGFGNDNELWEYNPVTGTPSMVADIEPGGAGSNPSGLLAFNGKLYFVAFSSVYGRELWSYNGVSATRLTDLAAGPLDGVMGSPCVYNGDLYFAGSSGGYDALYRYSPTTGSAVLIHATNSAGNSSPTALTVFKDKLYFSAYSPATGVELWVYDGSATTMVADIDPGTRSSFPKSFAVYNDVLYFNATTQATGDELFRLKESTDVQASGLKGSITVLPNPTRGDATLQLQLDVPQTGSLILCDAAGKTVWQGPAATYGAGTSTIALPLSGQPSGIYFYRLSNGSSLLAAGRIERR